MTLHILTNKILNHGWITIWFNFTHYTFIAMDKGNYTVQNISNAQIRVMVVSSDRIFWKQHVVIYHNKLLISHLHTL